MKVNPTGAFMQELGDLIRGHYPRAGMNVNDIVAYGQDLLERDRLNGIADHLVDHLVGGEDEKRGKGGEAFCVFVAFRRQALSEASNQSPDIVIF
jgi:hypothetical protein